MEHVNKSFDEKIRDLTGRQVILQRNIDNLAADQQRQTDILLSAKQTLQAKIDRCRSEEDTRKEGGWRCPLCGNRYSFADGLRYLTASNVCLCPEMPADLRKVRERRNQPDFFHPHGTQKHHEECAEMSRIEGLDRQIASLKNTINALDDRRKQVSDERDDWQKRAERAEEMARAGSGAQKHHGETPTLWAVTLRVEAAK
jgi:septal ring factor EnvC (AmiA/AmiB activator)